MSVRPRCACGCGQPSANRHHCVTQQALRRLVRQRTRDKSERRRLEIEIVQDRRNLIWLAFGCHGAHHARSKVLPLSVLPDSVFEFVAEVLGIGPGYEYLRSNYAGEDARLDALLAAA